MQVNTKRCGNLDSKSPTFFEQLYHKFFESKKYYPKLQAQKDACKNFCLKKKMLAILTLGPSK
jgi:hypothetical protein